MTSGATPMATLGLIGGMSWESTVLYYQHLNRMARERFGGLHSAPLLLWSFDFAQIEALQAAGDWTAATERLADAGRRLAGAGAQGLVICTNTMHRMADAVEAAAGVPVVHIADATAAAVRAQGAMAPLLLATRYTMQGNFYRGRMRETHGLDVRVPAGEDFERVNAVIYEELCRGIVSPDSKADYLDIIDRGVAAGADSVILGCTEVGLLVGEDDVGLPVFDSTRLHAAAAMAFAADGELPAAAPRAA